MMFQSKAVCDAEAGQSLDLNNVAAALAVRLLFAALVAGKKHYKRGIYSALLILACSWTYL